VMTDDVKVRESFWLFVCPHCGGSVLVTPDDLQCHIFRHGRFKTGTQQMNPHTSEAECDRLASQGLIWGCGKPFRVTYDGMRPRAEICGYI